MRRSAMLVPLVALLSGLPLIGAEADDRRGHGPPGYHYAPPANPWAAWRAYFGAQADLSAARRAARANAYVARGYRPPSILFGPPTNYYAERYALEPYSYFNCPLARRGEGVCSNPDFDWPQ